MSEKKVSQLRKSLDPSEWKRMITGRKEKKKEREGKEEGGGVDDDSLEGWEGSRSLSPSPSPSPVEGKPATKTKVTPPKRMVTKDFDFEDEEGDGKEGKEGRRKENRRERSSRRLSGETGEIALRNSVSGESSIEELDGLALRKSRKDRKKRDSRLSLTGSSAGLALRDSREMRRSPSSEEEADGVRDGRDFLKSSGVGLGDSKKNRLNRHSVAFDQRPSIEEAFPRRYSAEPISIPDLPFANRPRAGSTADIGHFPPGPQQHRARAYSLSLPQQQLVEDPGRRRARDISSSSLSGPSPHSREEIGVLSKSTSSLALLTNTEKKKHTLFHRQRTLTPLTFPCPNETLKERWNKPDKMEELHHLLDNGRTVLISAVLARAEANVTFILGLYSQISGLDVNATDERGSTALHASSEGEETNPCLLLLLAHPTINTNLPNASGKTALSLYIRSNHDPDRVSQVLLAFWKAGAKFDEISATGETLLHRALLNAAIRLLLFPILVSQKVDVNGVDHKQQTVLHFAVELSHFPSVEFLIDAGANPSLVNNRGETALAVAKKVLDQDNGNQGHGQSPREVYDLLYQVDELRNFLSGLPDDVILALVRERLFLDILDVEAVAALPHLAMGDRLRLEKRVKEHISANGPTIHSAEAELLMVKHLPKVDFSQAIKRDFPEMETLLIDASKVEYLKTLGKGSSAVVYQAYLGNAGEENRQMVAVKKFTDLQESEVPGLVDELKVLYHLKSPYLIEMIGISIHQFGLSLYLEYCAHGDLTHFLSQDAAKLTEALCLKWLVQMSAAIAHLHHHHTVHRDFKSDNVLIDSNYDAKVSDFGLSRSMDAGKTLNQTRGTPGYWPPELFSNHPLFTTLGDIFSLGIVVWEVWAVFVTKRWARPFAEFETYNPQNPLYSTVSLLLDGKRPTFPPEAPRRIAKLYDRMVLADPAKRPSARSVCAALTAIASELTGLTVDENLEASINLS